MAFDAGMLAANIAEIKKAALGARIEKVYQPEADEIILQMRSFEGGKRLLINAGSNNPRLGFTGIVKENPLAAPMFCMLLRKHLSGAKLVAIDQEGFERMAVLSFETRDEMGYPCQRKLIAEVMGKYSNLIFTDERQKILAVLRPVDFSTSSKRQVLPGMTYELPPQQNKTNPLSVTVDDFKTLYAQGGADRPADKWIAATFLGISAAVAREMVFRLTGHTDTALALCPVDGLWKIFSTIIDMVRESRFEPSIAFDGERPVEYAFCSLGQYESAGLTLKHFTGVGEVLDAYFVTRDHDTKVHQRAQDILHILTNANARIHKKMELQRRELADCDSAEQYKLYGDLITANLYLLSRGMKKATLTNYADMHDDGTFGQLEISLDERATPVANAQRFYKKYTKAKTARVRLAEQLKLDEEELAYIETVSDALSHAETAADLSQIREELFKSGYASKMKHYTAAKRPTVPVIMKFRTSGGYTVLCGKNNVQNEYITHKLAEKNDYWFHVKNLPGSHVLLQSAGRNEPAPQDFTEAAEIAAFYSKGQGGELVAVDYTLARNVKKPAGGKPGMVIYHTNWSAYVTPRAEKIEKLKIK